MSPSAYTLAEREAIAKKAMPELNTASIVALMAACFEVAVVLGGGGRSSLSEETQTAVREAAKELQEGTP